MSNIRLKISLLNSDPLIWREVIVEPDMDLPDLHAIIQVSMGWDDSYLHGFCGKKRKTYDPDDEEYYEITLSELFPRKGSSLNYTYDFGYSWEHLIESLGKVPSDPGLSYPHLVDGANACPPEDSGGLWGYYEKLDVLKDPKHEEHEWIGEWMGDGFDPTYFDLLATRQSFERIDWEGGEEDDFDWDEDGIPAFIDLDVGRERKINFAWMLQEHGIPLTQEHVRNTPKEITDFLEIAEAADDPAPFLQEAERLQKQYPKELNIYMALVAMYQFLGKEVKANRLLKKMPQPSPDDLLFNLGFIMESPDEETFVKRVRKFPQPLKLTNLPPGKGGLYHVEEFLFFEEMAIRYALAKNDLHDAVNRLDRLVEAGFLHGDVRGVAMMISGEQIGVLQAMMADPTVDPQEPIQGPGGLITSRTQEILDNSMNDVFDLMKQYDGVWDEDDEEYDDFPPVSGAKVIGLDPFRNIGRNDRINVRNTSTGEVIEKIKFKQVEARLRSGELELI
jgi:hypothetical protein